MKTLKLSATLMLLGTLTLSAATQTDTDTTTQNKEQKQEQKQTNSQSHMGASASVDAQITAIENAKTPEQRVALVNEFKTTISALSTQERATAISQYRSSMQASNGDAQDAIQTRQRSHEAQMKQTRSTQNAQMMNQYQTANQAMNAGMISGNQMMNAGGTMQLNGTTATQTGSGSTGTNFMSR